MNSQQPIIVDHLASVEMRPSRPDIYDQDIAVRLLFTDPTSGAEHYLIRYPAGLRAQPHRHSAAHTIVVLEGSLRVNETVIGPGAYAHFPAMSAMLHAPAGNEGCLLVFIFDGPQDVESLDEAWLPA
jgi:quercetin dioxygenase-like cupin family protein